MIQPISDGSYIADGLVDSYTLPLAKALYDSSATLSAADTSFMLLLRALLRGGLTVLGLGSLDDFLAAISRQLGLAMRGEILGLLRAYIA